ncbi:TadE/TadG family type IV pilus assembly protein [Methylomicrobium lacus]|uniref:TadE/TadG family type IV pilus assembly protein n=1 Tax=Methylomicrobium lacus TaxID=136992 RepID=UPI0009FF6431|nr:TadE/TadG family type IV pilus assembly protein [Methylomicrobium lacus]
MSRPIRNFKYRQTGATLVEFALVLPLLLLLLLGIVEFSYAFFHLNILNKSVQDGALYFSERARCTSVDNCSPNIAVNINTASNPYVSNAINLVMTGNTADCDDKTEPPPTPPLLPLCINYTSVNITQTDANHIQVSATYRHCFITGSTLSKLTKMTFGSSSASCPSSYDLQASSVMRAQ